MTRRCALPVALLAALAGAAGPALGADPPADDAGVTYLDVRDGAQAEAVAEARTDQPAGMDRAANRLVREQGPLAALQVDPTTGTVRSLADLGGALTGPSDETPVRTAKDYVRDNLVALGLTAADFATLRLDSALTTSDGVTHVRWTQLTDGIPAFDNGLTVDLDRGGRILGVGGSPLHQPDANTESPKLDAAGALRALMGRVGSSGDPTVSAGPSGAVQHTEFSDGSTAELVQFDANGLLRLAWRVRHRASPTEDYDAVIDAVSGRLLHRANFVKFAAVAQVFPHYPGAPNGGAQVPKNIDAMLFSPSTTVLSGPFARAYSDVNDSNTIDSGEEADPQTAHPFASTWAHSAPGGCAAPSGPLCSWDYGTAFSWQANRQQNAVQAFWFVNRYQAHLATDPIGFTPSTGGFACTRLPCDGTNDRVVVETDDGADTSTTTAGLPDDDHTDNANMSTPPDGQSPRMQMYLFYNGSSPFRDINGGDSAEIVYHEYTHGLSNRLVVDSSGAGALNSPQAASMGEAWSDWYAMDFLARQDPDGNVYVPDTTAQGEIDLGAYTDVTPNRIRSQPLDCAVGDATKCPGAGTAGSGGYTYGDFGKIGGRGPEVHADGEIWAETLWDLRTALIGSANLGNAAAVESGSDVAEQLITGAMRLSPPEPSYLDMRDAMLREASGLPNPEALRATIWEVFAERGMGFFAGTTDSDDTSPVESFDGPPTGPPGALSGTVRDALTGRPVAGVSIAIGGHTLQDGSSAFAAQSASDGGYSLPSVPQGAYKKVIVSAPGYDGRVIQNVAVPGTLDILLTRNWASAPGGGAITTASDETGSASGCGPSALINQSQAAGWSPWNPASPRSDFPDSLVRTAPTATIALPRAVDISSFGADPGATCGDDATATARQFTIETSQDGTTFATAYDGSGDGAFIPADAGRVRSLVPAPGTATGVRFVRLTLLSPQDIAGCSHPPCSGRDFIDFSELTVYGNGLPSGTLSAPAAATAGQPVTLDASSFTDDGTLTSYAWDFEGDGSFDQTTTTATTTHAYAATGTFTPQVRVTDNTAGSGIASTAIAVGPAPPVVKPVVRLIKPKLMLPRQTANRATIRVTCETRCTVTASLKANKALAKRLHLKRWAVGATTVRVKAGTTIVRVAVKKSVLHRLRARKIGHVTLALSVRIKDTRGLLTSAARSPRIPISKR